MNVLIAILSSNVNRKKTDIIIEGFDKNKYNIHVFDHAEERIESMIDLPTIVNYIKEVEEQPVERLVILSDVREFIFSWYRCYNSLVDDFIYSLNENNDFNALSIAKEMPYADFYEQLYNFSSIEQENNEGKIYINLDFTNLKEIGLFLLTNCNFKFFDGYCNFKFTDHIKKTFINKHYHYNKNQYKFDVFENADSQQITIESSENIEKNAEFYIYIQENCYWLFYLFIIIYKLDQQQRNNILSYISSNVKLDSDAKQDIYQCFVDYCEQPSVLFEEKIYVAALLVRLEIKENIYEKIMQLLLEDNQYIQYHYPVLVNTLSYCDSCGILEYKKMYHDRDEELQKIVKYYKKNIVDDYTPKIKRKRKRKRIAIHVSQLLEAFHSPTLLVLNYVKYLRAYYPEYEVKIFVDDIFVYHSAEVILPYTFSSGSSIEYRQIHEAFLQGTGATIYYSDSKKNRIDRTKKDLKEIYKFKPELVLSIGTIFTITREILYDNYPVMDMSLGGLSNSQHADLLIHGYEQSYIEQECDKYDYNIGNLEKGKILKHKGGVDFPKPTKKIRREEYNISTQDFVMITVGNRLDNEISGEFVDMVGSFVQGESNIKWIIVGNAELPYLKYKYPNLLNKQIIFITYENDLAALYGLCDIYINPFRQHGGYSAGMAMNQSLPVITLKMSDDVAGFVGIKNSVADSVEYLHEMQRLYEDEDYKNLKGKLMKQRIDEHFSFKNTINEIVNFFGITINEFNKRMCDDFN